MRVCKSYTYLKVCLFIYLNNFMFLCYVESKNSNTNGYFGEQRSYGV